MILNFIEAVQSSSVFVKYFFQIHFHLYLMGYVLCHHKLCDSLVSTWLNGSVSITHQMAILSRDSSKQHFIITIKLQNVTIGNFISYLKSHEFTRIWIIICRRKLNIILITGFLSFVQISLSFFCFAVIKSQNHIIRWQIFWKYFSPLKIPPNNFRVDLCSDEERNKYRFWFRLRFDFSFGFD